MKNSKRLTTTTNFKKLSILLVLSFLILTIGSSQDSPNRIKVNSFVELNVGFAIMSIHYDEDRSYFPGASVLWGQTFTNQRNYFIEYQAGLAFPTVVTAKLGIGKKINKTKISAGVRPYPLNLYAQITIPGPLKSGEWNISFEHNPRRRNDAYIDFSAVGNINAGYRLLF